jgi:tellurite methyltransferase
MKNYWEKFYQENHNLNIFKTSSSFSKFVLKKIKDYSHVIDLGCGNARDSVYFLLKGKNVISLDKSGKVIKLNKKKFKNKNINFVKFDISKNLSKVIKTKKPKCFYSRFVMHSLTKNLIKNHIKQLSKIFSNKDIFYMEYRCFEDKYKKKIYSNHYRNFMKTTDIEIILNKNNLYSTVVTKGVGFAKFGKEDPFIARHVVRKYI